MPYITREDGEHFVIPSYRDVLTSRNKPQLKKDIILLSQSYGEYITLQRKSAMQYEVAFSPDTGYLLGESIWHYFKRPVDMIYCEAIPNTSEALLVIVKAGSVYLDGSFPVDSIPEELIIFLTQQNSFEIYIYGDVPISQTPESGKFSFEASSVKSFTVLDQPVFEKLPLLKAYQLQLVDQVLKSQGIGVFPTRAIVLFLLVIALLWFVYKLFTTEESIIEPITVSQENPYQEYNATLMSPAPQQEMDLVVDKVRLVSTLPGWIPTGINYQNKLLTITITSLGGSVDNLFQWANSNNAVTQVVQTGFQLIFTIDVPNRDLPPNIYPLKQVMGRFVDRLAKVYPGNVLSITEITEKGAYLNLKFNLTIANASPLLLDLISDQFKDLPFVLETIQLTMENGIINGSIEMQALGSQL